MLFSINNGFSQSKITSEEELKKTANKSFDEQNYAVALPLYSQLLSLNTKEVLYHYRFGVCNLYAGKDKSKPISFLEYAAKNASTDKEVYYYLGRAYHLNYKFGEALTNYIKFKQTASSKILEKFDVDLQIQMCKNGLELLKNIHGLSVMEKKDLREADYFRAYDLSKINAKVIVKPDEYKTSLDKKKKESSVIVSRFDAKELFFSSYGVSGNTGKDIYKVQKLPDGKWSKPINVGSIINTPFDEDFPYLHPDGHTFYFSSKGHNSMGGYDVFKSEYDTVSQTFTTPQNVDFPINSTDDDILYITDKDNQTAYFSSNRISGAGEITIYKVKVERVAMALALVKGTFSAEDESKHPKAKLTVTNVDNARQVGVFNLKEGEGKFTLYIPTGTNYSYKLESLGYVTQVENVIFPEQAEMVTLEQKLLLKKVGGTDKLTVVNEFRTASDEEKKLLTSADVLRQQANIDVNYNPKQVKIIAAVIDTTPTKKEELIKLAETRATILQKSENELKIQANAALVVANKRNNESEKTKATEKQVEEKIASLPENQKAAETQKLKELQAKQLEQARQALVAYNTSKEIEQRLATTTNNLNKETAYLNTIKQAQLKNDNVTFDKAVAQHIKLNENEVLGTEFIVSNLSEKQKKNTEEINRLEAKNSKLTNEIKSVNVEIAEMQKQININKDKGVKASLSKQIFELNEDIRLKQNKMGENNISIAELTESNKILADQKQIIAENKTINTVLPVNSVELASLTKQMELYKSQDILERTIIVTNRSVGTNTQLPAGEIINLESTTTVATTNITTPTASNTNTTIVATTNITTPSTSKTTTVATTNITTPTTNTSNAATNNLIAQNTDLKNTIAQVETINTTYKNKLIEADKIEITKQKEEQKIILLNEWNTELNKNLAQINTLSANTNLEPNDKKLLEEFKKQSELKVDENKTVINTSTQVLATNNSTESVNANLVLSGTPQNKTKQAEAVIAKVNSNYQTQLSAANNIENTEQQQIEKNKIVQSWNNDLQLVASQLNSAQSNTDATPQDKNLIQNILAQINTQTAVNNNSSTLATNNSTESVNANVVLSGTPQNKTKQAEAAIASLNSNYQTQLSAANTIENNEAKQIEKNKIVQSWNNDLQFVATQLNSAQTNTDATPQDKNLIKNILTQINTQTTINNNSSALVDNKLNTNITPNGSDLATSSVSTFTPNDVELTTSSNSIISNSEAKAELKQADNLNKERENFIIESDKLDKKAQKITNTSEKKELSIRSKQMAEQAKESGVEAQKTVSIANEIQYKNNEAVIQNYVDASTQTDEGKTNVANLNNEAKNYNSEAFKFVIDAENTSDLEKKETLYKKSADYEKVALSKQQSAIKLLKGNDGRFKITVTPIPATVVKEERIQNIETAKNNKKQLLANAELKATADSLTQQEKFNNTLANNTTTQLTNNKPLFDSATITKIEKQQDYTNYTSLKNESKITETKAIEQQKQAEDFRKMSNQFSASAKQLDVVANETTDATQKTDALQKASVARSNQIRYTAMADSMSQLSQNNQNEALAKNTEAETFLQQLDKDLYEKAIVNYKQQSTTNNAIASNTNSTNTSNNNNAAIINTTTPIDIAQLVNEKNELKTDKVFEQATAPVYSSAKPIPINQKLPSGIVFKVQIGAFRNPIPADLFQGFNPVMGETIPNGITRYTAGLFKNFDGANQARREINNLGYRDAFVVAFCNGKRITVELAQQYIRQGVSCDGQQLAVTSNAKNNTTIANTNNTSVTNTSATNTNSNTVATINNTSTSTTVLNKTTIVIAPELNKVQGLLYTVQVGVYARPVTSDKLFNIIPLYVAIADNGYLRYSSGIYNNVDAANQARSFIVNVGIRDAFVVAYYNGKRISVAEAKQLESQMGANIYASIAFANTQPLRGRTQAEITNLNTTTVAIPKETIVPEVTLVKTEIVYKVQIGAFKEEVPLDKAKLFFNLSMKGPIANYVTDEKVTIFTFGNFTDYETANASKNDLINQGLTDAFVVAYINGNKITIEEAKQLNGK